MGLTHFNDNGRARMVNVSEKKDTVRTAVAKGKIRLKKETIKLIKDNGIKKGDVLAVAQVAGIMGSKKTADLIPMCHNIIITGSDINFKIFDNYIEIEAEVSTVGKTGIEMEALSAVSAAALTIYDMCKAVDKEMIIDNITLVKKTGGRSGDFYKEYK
ncbi:cyclic pyranopterin monophosphate synthase MoaC [Clostridium felsineum]|uniref:Cyclic pyranopterin monophosphate synthase n=1 Tax=Clostridium felsineum TaxID=36839 RepID=A0A1S8L1G4_9CLOT|nr:cyclic pyranopterin monophosphate synthase MoaC [Clostridium felsineum]URZ08815.1 Cyclic pyranopterin monophosphate synthase [Clostridium felsineum]URZ09443.1 Cyclic pyranopterin monophosphate synthase [Clostridium felsineum]